MKLRIVLVLVTGCLVSMFNACAPAGDAGSSDGGSNSPASNGAGLAAFKAVYDWSRTAKCSTCHNSTSPAFTQSDFNLAYAAAKTKLDLSNVDSSPLILKAGNGHCATSTCTGDDKIAAIKPLVEAWARAESAGGKSDTTQSAVKYQTSTVNMPANIPALNSNAATAVIRFELSQMQPAHPALGNAILEIEVRKATSTTYRLDRAKLVGNTAAVMVKGIHVYIKPQGAPGVGTEDTNQGMGWVSVQATAPTFARPATLPTTPLGATPVTNGAINAAVRTTTTGVNDVITIGFENLQ